MKKIKLNLSSLGLNTNLGFLAEELSFVKTNKSLLISIKTFIDEGGDIKRIVVGKKLVVKKEVLNYFNKTNHKRNGTVDKERLLKRIEGIKRYDEDWGESIGGGELDELIQEIKDDLI